MTAKVAWLGCCCSAVLFACSSEEPLDVCDEFTTAYCGPGEQAAGSWIAPECLPDDTSAIQATYGLLFEQDQDLPFDTDNGAHIGAWTFGDGRILLSDGRAEDAVVEGRKALCAEAVGTAGWWIEFRQLEGVAASRESWNFNEFERGRIEFELRSDVPVTLKLEWLDEDDNERAAELEAEPFATASERHRDWQSVSVPLCAIKGVNLSAMWSPFGLFATGGTSGLYCVDAVRWVQGLRCPNECNG